jgi:hypothetical protein
MKSRVQALRAYDRSRERRALSEALEHERKWNDDLVIEWLSILGVPPFERVCPRSVGSVATARQSQLSRRTHPASLGCGLAAPIPECKYPLCPAFSETSSASCAVTYLQKSTSNPKAR